MIIPEYLIFRHSISYKKYKVPINYSESKKLVTPEIVEQLLKKNLKELKNFTCFVSGGLDSSTLAAMSGVRVIYTASFPGFKDAHGEGFEYSHPFCCSYYSSYPKERKLGRVLFRVHTNHPGWKKGFIDEWIDSPVEFTPSILSHSNGIYASHFSFMLIEAAILDKPVYICPQNDQWLKVENRIHEKGWWSGFDWRGLEKEEKRKEVKSWFTMDGKSSERVANIILKYL